MEKTLKNIENELSFLVRKPPELTGIPFVEIEQHYLDDDPEPLRLRSNGQKFEITRKLGVDPGDLSRRNERNLPLTRGQFERLKPLSLRHLAKTRYFLPLDGGLTAELDVFHGSLEGLVMVEVEFADETARLAFSPPPWFGRDISQEAWSANSYLAGRSFAEISKYL